MNVFVITSVPMNPPWDQGDKNFAYVLTSALPQVSFQVMTSRQGTPPKGDNLIQHKLFPSPRVSYLQKSGVYLRMIAQTHSPAIFGKDAVNGHTDIFHFIYRPNSLSTSLFKLLPKLHRRPKVHTMPAIGTTNGYGPELFFADRVIAFSEYGRQLLQDSGVKNVIHIPPGIYITNWASLSHQTAHRKGRLGLGDQPVILYPGHFGAHHGLSTLLEALPNVVSRVPNVCFIFACRLRSPEDYVHERNIQGQISRMTLTANVRFYNTVSDMLTLIGASDIVVFPFLNMRDKVDIPTTLLEAMAAGKSVVISDIPPMNEIMASSTNSADNAGLTVPPGDPNALAEALSYLLIQEKLRERMGLFGSALVKEKHDILQVASKYEALYHDLLG